MTAQRFNLLPHRQMRRDTAFRLLCRQLFAIALLAIACAWVGKEYLDLRLGQAASFRSTLQGAIGELMPQAQLARQLQQRYAYLRERQVLMESLDARRSTSVLLLADVANALPQTVYLTRFEENGERLVVVGRAIDSDSVADFMAQVAKSPYVTDVALDEIRSQDPDVATPFQFSLTARVILVNQIVLRGRAGTDGQ
ncbi:MAG: PilN domain-containing protein [Fluviibacter sp.]